MRQLVLILAAAASPAAAELSLIPPVDCTIGQTCYIQQYPDRDPGPDASDFRCQGLTYDAHTGTDFAVFTHADMMAGVDAVASAPGVVTGTRDGMIDKVYAPEDAETLDGRDCGNGVAIDHGNGWTAQYCHLKQGSVAVRTGDRVTSGQKIGQVGMSGRAQFPHVSLVVRKDGTPIDPFHPGGDIDCDAPQTQTLWSVPPIYQPGGLIGIGFAPAIPEFDAIKAGTAAVDRLAQDAEAVVLFGYGFGVRVGDEMRLTVQGPNGPFSDRTVTLEREQALVFRAIGRKLRQEAWASGTYHGTVTLLRAGQPISQRTTTVTIP